MSSSNNGGQRTLDSWISKRSDAPRRTEASSSSAAATSAENVTSSTQAPSSSQSSTQSARNDPWRRGSGLAAVATETRQVLPDILAELPDIHAGRSEVLYEDRLPQLKPSDCPKKTASGKVKIKIVNDDSFNAAIDLAASKSSKSGRVAVLNMASNISPGGGWRKGARAQEEALCYRSSLYLSLHKRYYPWKQRQGIYTPDVVIIRSDQSSGHNLLMPEVNPDDLPVVSVLSIAALRRPPVDNITIDTADGGTIQRSVFARPSDRELTKTKMRLCLRMAASRGHGLLVLGALGCGAFRNPPKEVAHCWLEVLKENEFKGGWWEEIWFAVFDRRGEGNLEVFEEILGDVQV